MLKIFEKLFQSLKPSHEDQAEQDPRYGSTSEEQRWINVKELNSFVVHLDELKQRIPPADLQGHEQVSELISLAQSLPPDQKEYPDSYLKGMGILKNMQIMAVTRSNSDCLDFALDAFKQGLRLREADRLQEGELNQFLVKLAMAMNQDAYDVAEKKIADLREILNSKNLNQINRKHIDIQLKLLERQKLLAQNKVNEYRIASVNHADYGVSDQNMLDTVILQVDDFIMEDYDELITNTDMQNEYVEEHLEEQSDLLARLNELTDIPEELRLSEETQDVQKTSIVQELSKPDSETLRPIEEAATEASETSPLPEEVKAAPEIAKEVIVEHDD